MSSPKLDKDDGEAFLLQLGDLVRVYEEFMVVENAAGLFRDHAVEGAITLTSFFQALPQYSTKIAHKIFSNFDADHSGSLSAAEFLNVVRFLNFIQGICSKCLEPIDANSPANRPRTCENGLLLCKTCCQLHTEEVENPDSLTATAGAQFSDDDDGEYYPKGTGMWLRMRIDSLFRQLDTGGKGSLTRSQISAYLLSEGLSTSRVARILECASLYLKLKDITRRQLMNVEVARKMMVWCNECGAGEFIGSGRMLCCVECIEDYNICTACFAADYCSHEHEKYRPVEVFQLRHAGLRYKHIRGAQWKVDVMDAEKYSKYQPFLEGRIETRAMLGEPSKGKTQSSEPLVAAKGASSSHTKRRGELKFGQLATKVTKGAQIVLSALSVLSTVTHAGVFSFVGVVQHLFTDTSALDAMGGLLAVVLDVTHSTAEPTTPRDSETSGTSFRI